MTNAVTTSDSGCVQLRRSVSCLYCWQKNQVDSTHYGCVLPSLNSETPCTYSIHVADRVSRKTFDVLRRLPISNLRRGITGRRSLYHPLGVSINHAAATKRSPSADRRTRRLDHHDPESGDCVFFASTVSNEFSVHHHTRQWSHDTVDVVHLRQNFTCRCSCCCTCPHPFSNFFVLGRFRDSGRSSGHPFIIRVSRGVFRVAAIVALVLVIAISTSFITVKSNPDFKRTIGSQPITFRRNQSDQGSSRGFGFDDTIQYNNDDVKIKNLLRQHSGVKLKQRSINNTRKSHQSTSVVLSRTTHQSIMRAPKFSDTCPFRRTYLQEDCNNPDLTKQQKPCLKRLKGIRFTDRRELLADVENTLDSGRVIIDSLIPPEIWRSLVKIPGEKLDTAHLSLVPLFTSLQWKNGVYGSVGHIGDIGYGKFTSLLARVVDTNSGERMFFADLVVDVQPQVSSPNQSASVAEMKTQQHPIVVGINSPFESIRRRDVVAANVRATTGLDEMAADPARRLFVYHGSLLKLSRSLRTAVGSLPQFRVFAVDIHSSTPDHLTLSLEMAVCTLSDGGLIILDGTSDALVASVRRFIDRNGSAIIAPLLVVGNKLYLTTTNFRRKYYDSIMNVKDWIGIRLDIDINEDNLAGFNILRL